MPTGLAALLPAMLVSLTLQIGTGRIDDIPVMPDVGQTWVEIDGALYGAKPDETGPIGGGAGYTRIVTDGEFNVSTADELREALGQAQFGDVVYVRPDADIDCTTLVFAEEFVIEVPEGVTLAGNRGQDGARGPIIYSDAFRTRPLIRATGPDVRITGLRIRGPDPKPRIDHHRRSFSGPDAPGHGYYYKFPVSQGIATSFSGLEVDNCELSGWSHAAISLSEGADHWIHHNFIHHNQMNGLGYGVSHGYGAQSVSLIEYNLFDYNRHSIAGTGKVGNAYEARHNVEVRNSLSHYFDMHGGGDRRDGTNIAGDWMRVHHNTFRGTHVAAVVIRGVPTQTAEIHNNWFFHEAPGGRVIRPWPTGGATNVQARNNAYGAESPRVDPH